MKKMTGEQLSFLFFYSILHGFFLIFSPLIILVAANFGTGPISPVSSAVAKFLGFLFLILGGTIASSEGLNFKFSSLGKLSVIGLLYGVIWLSLYKIFAKR